MCPLSLYAHPPLSLFVMVCGDYTDFITLSLSARKGSGVFPG